MIKVEAVINRSLKAAKESSVAVAGGTVFSSSAWAFAGLVYLAETGCNYRKMKEGKISKAEFKRSTEEGAVGVVGGLAGASGGAATGFIIGSAVCPGIGSIIGTITGAVIGGLEGKKYSIELLEKIEQRVEKVN